MLLRTRAPTLDPLFVLLGLACFSSAAGRLLVVLGPVRSGAMPRTILIILRLNTTLFAPPPNAVRGSRLLAPLLLAQLAVLGIVYVIVCVYVCMYVVLCV